MINLSQEEASEAILNLTRKTEVVRELADELGLTVYDINVAEDARMEARLAGETDVPDIVDCLVAEAEYQHENGEHF